MRTGGPYQPQTHSACYPNIPIVSPYTAQWEGPAGYRGDTQWTSGTSQARGIVICCVDPQVSTPAEVPTHSLGIGRDREVQKRGAIVNYSSALANCTPVHVCRVSATMSTSCGIAGHHDWPAMPEPQPKSVQMATLVEAVALNALTAAKRLLYLLSDANQKG